MLEKISKRCCYYYINVLKYKLDTYEAFELTGFTILCKEDDQISVT